MAEPRDQPGQRFALSATLQQLAVEAESNRFALKGGLAVLPGACGDVVFCNGFE